MVKSRAPNIKSRSASPVVQGPARVQKPTPKPKSRRAPSVDIEDPTDPPFTSPRGGISNRELDLDHSYVGEVAIPPKPPKPPRHPRWKHVGEPLYQNLPEGWTDSEPDLSEDDVEGQIKRCKERIEDNIMVATFQIRLSYLESKKEHYDEMFASEPHGLSLQVVQRLDSLKRIEKSLEKEDQYGQLVNVQAVMHAYRSAQLGWNPRLVTYWTDGRQICQPRPFSWDEFHEIKARVKNDKCWWIEGLHGTTPSFLCARFSLPGDARFMHYKKFDFRIPGRTTTSTLDIMDDTGATFMTLYEDDIKTLMVPKPINIPAAMVIGTVDLTTSDGTNLSSDVVELEISLNHMGVEFIPWKPVQVALFKGRYHSKGCPRLGGPVLSSLLYTASAPDNRNRLLVSNDRDEILDLLPDADIANAQVPEWDF